MAKKIKIRWWHFLAAGLVGWYFFKDKLPAVGNSMSIGEYFTDMSPTIKIGAAILGICVVLGLLLMFNGMRKGGTSYIPVSATRTFQEHLEPYRR